MLYRKGMGQYSAREQPDLPETLVVRLASHLKRHALWDVLLLLFPPLLVFSSIVIFLYHSDWVGRETLIAATAPFVGLALLTGFLRFRAVAPSPRSAAHLIDERVGGKDRFITLATIQASVCPPFLLARLRREASGLMRHLDPAGDFPYRIKRSFFQSLIGSLSVVLLFLLFQQIGSVFAPARDNELAPLAQKLSSMARFSELARSLEVFAARMRDQGLSAAEKRSSIREVLKRVESQLAAERRLGGAANDLLNQTAGALRGMEQGLEKGQGQGAGGLNNDQTGEGKGSGKDSGQKGGEKEPGELSALEIKEQKGGQPERGERQEMGKKQPEKNRGGGEKDESGKGKSDEVKGMAKGELGGKVGSYKYKEEDIPRGAAAERFQKPGEQGEKGIKGARFVTVELPEEEAGGSTGEGGLGKRRGIRPKVPTSNAPLRQPDSPDGVPEKQPLPLEYRGLIR